MRGSHQGAARWEDDRIHGREPAYSLECIDARLPCLTVVTLGEEGGDGTIGDEDAIDEA